MYACTYLLFKYTEKEREREGLKGEHTLTYQKRFVIKKKKINKSDEVTRINVLPINQVEKQKNKTKKEIKHIAKKKNS